uniref:Uncharacterized protein n=1 Tax=Arundo donax TaxID=35708 RepID=A0A0A8YHZ2_ARUDO
MDAKCHHIPRALNYIADSLARNVQSLRSDNVIFNCSIFNHQGHCPFKEKLCNWP